MLGKNKIAPAILNITIILAIVFLAINGLNRTIPNNVKTDASNDKIEKNCSLKFRTSISNQVNPGPGPGIALKIKIITAVPTIVNLKFSGSSLIKLNIKNKMIITDPVKTISCAKDILKDPTDNEKITNIKLPPKIHQLTFGLSSPLSSLNFKPCISKFLIFLFLRELDKITPKMEIKGIIKA